MALELGNNEFLTYNLDPTTYSIMCYNNTILQGLQLTKIHTIRVPRGCYIELPKFRLSHTTNLFINEKVKTFTFLANMSYLVPVPGTPIEEYDKALEIAQKLACAPCPAYAT